MERIKCTNILIFDCIFISCKVSIFIDIYMYLYCVFKCRDVQLLVACCIADILRIFAPDAPYKEPQQIKTIFLFLIRQLGGLRDPKEIFSFLSF